MLQKASLRLLLVLVSLTSFCIAAPLRIGTSVLPPYQYSQNGQIKGDVVDVVSCAMFNANLIFDIEIIPRLRGLSKLESNELDFMFSLEKEKTETIGQRSMPLVFEKWFWYSFSESLPTTNDTIGVVAGSSQESWLALQPFKNIELAHSLESLLKMMQFQRIDYLLADETSIDFLVTEQPELNQVLYKRFSRFSTLTGVFSRAFSAEYPDKVEAVNDGILLCTPLGMELDAETQAFLEEVAGNLQKRLEIPELLSQTMRAIQWEPVPDEKLTQARDRAWQNHRETPSDYVYSLLENTFSEYLRELESNPGGYVTELFVTNAQGHLLATSQLTSDYWQGDELTVIRVQKDTALPYISPIYFDRSTELFQAQISLPLLQAGKLIGVVVVGIDVEEAYRLFR